MLNTNKLIATYSRVSTARQEEEQTIKTQINVLHEFATKNGYLIVQEYIDDGWSGDILARPALDKLRQDAKSKSWDCVLIYDPDRLARRYSYQELVMDELREAGIEIIFVTITAPKNSEDKILYGVRGLFAEYERTKISERFRLGKLRKVKEGHVLTSEAPYGYRYIPKRDRIHGYYEINEDEAKIVRMMFQWITEGYTIRKIIKRLHELGIAPRKSKRGVWATSTLCTLFKNKTYIGEAHWGKQYAVIPQKPFKVEKYRKIKKTSRRKRPEEEWIKISVPGIIKNELFLKVQNQLKSNYDLSQRNKKNEYLLSGKIRCICGRARAGEGSQHGKHLYYRCADRVYNYPLPPKCLEKGINARNVDKLVWEQIASLMSSPELLFDQINRWIASRQVKSESSIGDASEMQKEISKLNEEETRYNKAYGLGFFTIEQLTEYTNPIKERIAGLRLQIGKIQQEKNETSSPLPTSMEIEKFAEKAKLTLKNLDFKSKRAIVLNVVDSVACCRDSLQVFGYIPVDGNIGLCSDHTDRENTIRHTYSDKLIPFNFKINLLNIQE